MSTCINAKTRIKAANTIFSDITKVVEVQTPTTETARISHLFQIE